MKRSCIANHLALLLLVVTGCATFRPVTGQQADDQEVAGRLTIAACQFPVSADMEDNARWITQQMKAAAERGAHVVQFPECALSGYPGVDLETLEGYPWGKLREHSERIAALAGELKLWVLLGSMHPLGEGVRPMNSLYVINSEGMVLDRYDKRFCTYGDLDYFSPGNHSVVFELNGVRCGILICFDVRFPELYREYRRLGADLIFQSFYNARQKPGGIHPRIMPVTAQGHAGINHFYMSLTNSSAASSWPCHFITPDGLVAGKLEPDQPDILFSEIDLSEKFYDASKGLRDRALQGHLSSEDPPVHPRYTRRDSF